MTNKNTLIPDVVWTPETSEEFWSLASDPEIIRKCIDEYFNDPWKYEEEHRRGISDIQWAKMQPMEQNFFIGDVIEFKVGGFGVITGASKGGNGWPPSYSTEKVNGLEDRKDTKRAWHYEGDFKSLVSKSGLRTIQKLLIKTI